MTRRWVVVEAESRPGVLGGTELLAIQRLREAGMECYWPHYRYLSPPRHIGNWRERKPVPVLLGMYPPWFFVAVGEDIEGEVGRINNTKYVADMLWRTNSKHYLDSAWLDWLVSDQPHPNGLIWYVTRRCGDHERAPTYEIRVDGPEPYETEWGEVLTPQSRPWPRPKCLNSREGLFEQPDQTARKAAVVTLKPGDRVRTNGKWASFEQMTGYRSVVERINTDGTIRVQHSQMFGKPQSETYDPLQVEPLS